MQDCVGSFPTDQAIVVSGSGCVRNAAPRMMYPGISRLLNSRRLNYSGLAHRCSHRSIHIVGTRVTRLVRLLVYRPRNLRQGFSGGYSDASTRCTDSADTYCVTPNLPNVLRHRPCDSMPHDGVVLLHGKSRNRAEMWGERD